MVEGWESSDIILTVDIAIVEPLKFKDLIYKYDELHEYANSVPSMHHQKISHLLSFFFPQAIESICVDAHKVVASIRFATSRERCRWSKSIYHAWQETGPGGKSKTVVGIILG